MTDDQDKDEINRKLELAVQKAFVRVEPNIVRLVGEKETPARTARLLSEIASILEETK